MVPTNDSFCGSWPPPSPAASRASRPKISSRHSCEVPRLSRPRSSGIALALAAAELKGLRAKKIEDLSWTDTLAIGVAQALAIVPGVSRSGITLAAAMFRGMKRDAAARFSFLLATPIIGGAAIKKMFDLLSSGLTADEAVVLGTGILSAAIVGYLAIAFMLRFLAVHTTYVFIYYRIGLGIVVLLAFLSGFR